MYAVTRASGHLGRLAVQELLARGVPPSDIVAIVRTRGKVADLAERGVDVCRGDLEVPATIDAAMQGVTSVVLVSPAIHRQELNVVASAFARVSSTW